MEQEEAEHPSTSVAALVRVGKLYGLEFRADELIRSSPFEGVEPPPALLKKMAERMGLSARLSKIKHGGLDSLDDEKLPAILFLNDGKAVVLSRIHREPTATKALIEDPIATGDVSALLDESRLFAYWQGDMLTMERRWKLTDQEQPFGFWWLAGQLVKERKLVRDITVSAFFMSLLALFPALTLMVAIDRVLYNRSLSTLGVIALAMVLVTIFDTIFGYLRRYLIMLVTSRIDARLNLYIFDRLLNLQMAYFERVPTGRINGKLWQIGRVRTLLTNQVFGTLLDSITLLVLLPVLFYINTRLTFFVIALALLILGIYVMFLPGLRRANGKLIEAEQAMGSHQVETIYGIRTVKSLSLEGSKRFQRDRLVAGVVSTHQALDRLANWPQTLVTPIERLIYVGSFLIGCYMALEDVGSITAGGVMAFSMLAGRVTGPIVSMASMINAAEEARGAMGQVAEVMNQPPEEGRTGLGLKLPIAGRVVFDEVRFRYRANLPYALNGVSFEIPRGTIFGCMGRSGSGKTTVTRLLQGLNREYEGTIKIDGMDLKQIDLDHLRANIGVVPQDNFLFSGTVRENISAARPNAGMDRIIRAAQLAGAEEFIERLERGYDTYVEEGASNFSGGQKQRLAIARALLLEPQILILDEATSALDAESEAIVNANLLRIAKDRTVIIISHRLSVLTACDAILVLERGKFYDCGRHEDLLERCDIYQLLWYQQNRHLDPNHVRPTGRPTSLA